MKTSRSRGFTLTELLVAITIIIVLAALIFSLSSRAINSAQKAVCVTNLRGIGNAIQAYVTENNNRLPGPLNVGQSALFNGASPSIVTYIAKYMEDERPASEGPYLVSNFGCPSIMKRIKDNSLKNPPVVYRMGHDNLENNRGEKGFPWIWNNPAGTTAKPWRVDEINPRSAGRVYAMIEQDQSMGGTWLNNGATGPAHGAQRMALFFDWSVRPVNVSEWK
jgi:prepilin-type N-terminal cleavage/methylation domain-containing protein